VEVKVNLGYLKDSNGEYEESPKINRVKYFHYLVELDSAGRIIGGRFYPDSANIDMLWMPLQPKQGRQPGNKAGNPYLKVNEILSIWRDSVPEELRERWVVIDPPNADSRLVLEKERDLIPIGYDVVRPHAPVEVEVAETEVTPQDEQVTAQATEEEPAAESLASQPPVAEAAEPLVVESMILSEADGTCEIEEEITNDEASEEQATISDAADPLDDLFRDLPPVEPATEPVRSEISDRDQDTQVERTAVIVTDQDDTPPNFSEYLETVR
jgi:hypothetical protein